MAWSADTAFSDQTAINNTTEEFLSKVSLNPREISHVQLKADNESGSVTDDLQVSVYATLDTASEVYDDVPLMQFLVSPTGVSAEYISFTVGPGIYAFRIGGLSTGSTDTYTMGGSHREDGVSA